MLYTATLILEFAPVALERYKLEKLHAQWQRWAPYIIIAMLTLFMLAMTYSFIWAAVLFVILIAWEVLMRAGIMPRDKQMPIIMIMAGVLFSTMHQSSLGSLFLAVPHVLHPLWYSPMLPIMFLLSAILAGPAMVTFESLLSERSLKHPARFDLLQGLSKAMPWLLGLYMMFKLGDVLIRGVVVQSFAWDPQAISWWGEMLVGAIIPFALFLTPEIRQSKAGMLWGSVLVVIGVIWNRLNVAVVGNIVQEWESYYPFWSEIFITIGIVAIGLIVFRWTVNNMPVYEHEPAGSH
jgi:formate dehydrogenase iron-sulfur subunit